MREVMYKLFSKLFDERIEAELVRAINVSKELERKKRSDHDIANLEFYVNKPVIVISNEIDNPVIGFGQRVQLITLAQTPVLIVKDYVSGEERMCLSNPYFYSEQLFHLVMDSDRNALNALLYTNRYTDTPFCKNTSEPILNKNEMIQTLIENGFVARHDEWKASK